MLSAVKYFECIFAGARASRPGLVADLRWLGSCPKSTHLGMYAAALSPFSTVFGIQRIRFLVLFVYVDFCGRAGCLEASGVVRFGESESGR